MGHRSTPRPDDPWDLEAVFETPPDPPAEERLDDLIPLLDSLLSPPSARK
jgi:hypothetical protein